MTQPLVRNTSIILRDSGVKEIVDEQLTHNSFEPAGYLGSEPLLPSAPSSDDGNGVVVYGDNSILNFLRGSPHLYMVPASELRFMASSVLHREYGYLDTVLNYGDGIDHVFLVLLGNVEVFALQPNGSSERVGGVCTGDFFGFDAVIFEEKSEFRYVAAASRRTAIGLIPKHLFLEVLERNVAVAQSVGRKLSEHMDIFLCFKDFCRHVFSHETAKNEYLPLWTILDSYTQLNNCIHAKMKSSELDTGAWSYAIRRLPENVTTTFCFDLVRALPPFVASRMRTLSRNVDKKLLSRNSLDEIRFIATKERRRCSWELGMHGKTMVLLRDSFTDILDFITCLCIHIIESNKLRARLQGMVHPPAIDILDEVLHRDDVASMTAEQLQAETKSVLSRMPLSKEEQNGLFKLWPNDCLRRLYEIIMHREEFMLRVDASISRRFQTDPFHEWALNLRAAVMHKCSLPSTSPLPSDLIIDIISSNTHCTKNLLGPFARKHREAILTFAEEKGITSMGWFNIEDCVYYSSVSFMQSRPDLQAEYNSMLSEHDITVMEDTAMTGLQVDIIPCHRLDTAMIDPLLAAQLYSGKKKKCFQRSHFILNMDFAFGAQAEGITKTLIATFGRSIRSINVMGKAGGLTGARGDVQVASHVLLSKSSLTTEDFQDELRACGNEDISAARVRELIGPSVGVHEGVVLTIPGTMLQNVKLLRFYKRIWKCVGVEMEGSYFARMIHEMKKAEIVSPELKTRFLYYTSDLPLAVATDSNLATPMRPTEGVPPLYAVARAILERVLAVETCIPDRGTSPRSTSPPPATS